MYLPRYFCASLTCHEALRDEAVSSYCTSGITLLVPFLMVQNSRITAIPHGAEACSALRHCSAVRDSAVKEHQCSSVTQGSFTTVKCSSLRCTSGKCSSTPGSTVPRTVVITNDYPQACSQGSEVCSTMDSVPATKRRTVEIPRHFYRVALSLDHALLTEYGSCRVSHTTYRLFGPMVLHYKRCCNLPPLQTVYMLQPATWPPYACTLGSHPRCSPL